MLRTEYPDRNNTTDDTFGLHRSYYAQFVTPALQQAVVSRFGLAELDAALTADKHMNSIPLAQWDRMEPIVRSHCDRAMRAAGDSASLANAVCVLKEAARQAVEDYRARRDDR